MKLEVETPAEEEIGAAADWLESRQVGLSREFLDDLSDAFDRILELPHAWGLVSELPNDLSPVRQAQTNQFSYYLPNPDTVRVVAAMHERQRPNYWVERLRP